jgi:hypothetical protein
MFRMPLAFSAALTTDPLAECDRVSDEAAE